MNVRYFNIKGDKMESKKIFEIIAYVLGIGAIIFTIIMILVTALK